MAYAADTTALAAIDYCIDMWQLQESYFQQFTVIMVRPALLYQTLPPVTLKPLLGVLGVGSRKGVEIVENKLLSFLVGI
jgi:hypothetical protein